MMFSVKEEISTNFYIFLVHEFQGFLKCGCKGQCNSYYSLGYCHFLKISLSYVNSMFEIYVKTDYSNEFCKSFVIKNLNSIEDFFENDFIFKLCDDILNSDNELLLAIAYGVKLWNKEYWAEQKAQRRKERRKKI